MKIVTEKYADLSTASREYPPRKERYLCVHMRACVCVWTGFYQTVSNVRVEKNLKLALDELLSTGLK